MHEHELEDVLRATLRAEADSVPFTLGPAALRVRSRNRDGRRRTALAGILTAAASIAVVVVAVLGSRSDSSEVANPSPSMAPPSSSVPAPTASPAATTGTPSTGELFAPDTAIVSRVRSRDGGSEPEILFLTRRFDGTGPRELAVVEGGSAGEYRFDLEVTPLASPAGYAAVPARSRIDGSRAVLVYDLRVPDQAPHAIALGPGSGAFAWGPTGQLAYDAGDRLGVFDPVLGIPVAEWSDHDVLHEDGPVPFLWTPEGDLVARDVRDDGAVVWGVVGPSIDYTATPNGKMPTLAQITGLERPESRLGESAQRRCADGVCTVSVVDGVTGTSTVWASEAFGTREATLDGFSWTADGIRLWAVDHATVGDGPGLRGRLKRVELPGLASVDAQFDLAAGDRVRVVGIHPDDRVVILEVTGKRPRLVWAGIDPGNLVVKPAESPGERFAGWGFSGTPYGPGAGAIQARHTFDLAGPPHERAMVTVIDDTFLVAGVVPSDVRLPWTVPGEYAVRVRSDLRYEVHLAWSTGPCQDRPEIRLSRPDGTLRLRIDRGPVTAGPCGEPRGRQTIAIRLSRPVASDDDIEVEVVDTAPGG